LSRNRAKMSLDQKLRDTEYIKAHSWGKIVTYMKRQFDHWATEKLSENGYSSFKMAYMPVLMNIKADGTNNNELAKLARVTKQAMSKVARELIESGYIKTKTDPHDKRSTIFMLTDKGKKLVIEARLHVKDLMDEYRQLIGAEEYDKTLQTLIRIIEFTDHKLQRTSA
jgi:DNA-binding MarR family transcriptional regulator